MVAPVNTPQAFQAINLSPISSDGAISSQSGSGDLIAQAVNQDMLHTANTAMASVYVKYIGALDLINSRDHADVKIVSGAEPKSGGFLEDGTVFNARVAAALKSASQLKQVANNLRSRGKDALAQVIDLLAEVKVAKWSYQQDATPANKNALSTLISQLKGIEDRVLGRTY